MDSPDKNRDRWYLKPVVVILALLAAGPFALPLVWISPAFRNWHKILITIAVAIITIWLFKACVDLYSTLSVQIQDLQNALR